MRFYETEMNISLPESNVSWFDYLSNEVGKKLGDKDVAIRFVVTQSDSTSLTCEVGVLETDDVEMAQKYPSIFSTRTRKYENQDTFNVALVIPTGIGTEIGGYAGDATPVSQLFGSICDKLILHPNVVNASDLNEMPSNSIYVEGSVLSRLFNGSVGLRAVRSNRILTVMDKNEGFGVISLTQNAANAAVASMGYDCRSIVCLEPGLRLTATESSCGRVSGSMDSVERLHQILHEYRAEYDAIAVSSIVHTPPGKADDYFQNAAGKVNPWGGAEAMLTHFISSAFNVPSAHAPMFGDLSDADELLDCVVDPRIAAECISSAFVQCVYKGLARSPKVVEDPSQFHSPDVFSVENISCLVIPDKCIGLPTLAALEQGIPVIAVKENRNIMKNSLSILPWKKGQLHYASTYLEAAGIACSIKSGISLQSLKRPIEKIPYIINTKAKV